MPTDSQGAEPNLFEVLLPPSPYPGLRPFQKSEWPIFFGRETMTDTVVELLLRQQFLLVHGPSGNGKSSLIRAGVLPRLEQQHARSGVRWRTCISTPGEKPLTNLAKSFVDEQQPLHPIDWLEFRRVFNRGKDAAAAIAKLAALGSDDRLCILIDQFEEIFSKPRAIEAEQVKLLSDFLVGFGLAPPSGLYVLLTMRSEFLGLCSRFEGLAEAVNKAQYLLPRMETENLLRAVREPALLYKGKVGESLAEKLTSDARTNQDELPLVQHALSQMWEAAARHGSNRILDISDYPFGSSLSSLMSRHANAVMQKAVASEEEGARIVEELFRALTEVNAEGLAIRRPRRFSELVSVTGATETRLRAILDFFRDPGVSFVTPYPPAKIEADTLIDISHEALIRHWNKISDPQTGWLQREFRDGVIWQSLRVQAESFISDQANLLSAATTEARTAWLQRRNEAWALRYGGMWNEVLRLLEASRKEVKRLGALERERLNAAQKAKHNRNYMILSLLAALAFAGFAYEIKTERDGAVVHATEAEDARKKEREARKKAESESKQRLIAQQLAEDEGRRADDARKLAEQKTKAAFDAQKIAEERRDEAERAKQDAVDNFSRAAAEAQKRDEESHGADTLQYASAKSYVASQPGKRSDVLKRSLERLSNERDPPQISFLGQVIGQLTDTANSEQIRSTIDILSRRLVEHEKEPASSGLAQALINVATNLNRRQAQAEADFLLNTSKTNDDRIGAIALTLGALGPSLEDKQLSGVERFLYQALMVTSETTKLTAILNALSNLGWAPSPSDFGQFVSHISAAVDGSKDPDLVRSLVAAIAEMAPKLSRADVELANSLLQPLNKQFADVIGPASSALAARLKQLSAGKDANPSQTLLDRIAGSGNRWCVIGRSYSLQISGSNAVWRDSSGGSDQEQILANSALQAQTKTLKSVHSDGKSEPVGTVWTYRLAPPNKVSVSSTSGKRFTLSPC